MTLADFWKVSLHKHTNAEIVDKCNHIIGTLYSDSLIQFYPDNNERVLDELGAKEIINTTFDEESMIIDIDYECIEYSLEEEYNEGNNTRE